MNKQTIHTKTIKARLLKEWLLGQRLSNKGLYNAKRLNTANELESDRTAYKAYRNDQNKATLLRSKIALIDDIRLYNAFTENMYQEFIEWNSKTDGWDYQGSTGNNDDYLNLMRRLLNAI